MLFDLADKLVWVAGQHGMVGGAMMRRLEREPCALLRDPGRGAVDLRRQSEVEEWMASQRPRIVFLTAGRVGGMYADDAFPADFLYDNLLIEANIIHAAYRTGVEKLLFFGSSCIYPREAPQPIPEAALLTGPLEPTNEAYTVASTAATSYRRCRPIFTARATIFIPRPVTSRRHYCGAFTKPKWRALPKSSSGAAARLGASFSTSTISPTLASTFCGIIRGSRISMSARVTTSRLRNSPNTLNAAWASRGALSTTGRDRTERRASCSTAVASKRWAGRPPHRSRRGLSFTTTGFCRTKASCGRRSSRRQYPSEALEWKSAPPFRTSASVVTISQPLVLDRTRIYVIGDIHGRSDLLDRMVDQISRDLAASPARDCVTVTLGDYMDRGPDSRGVLDRLVRNPFPTDFVALKGNHEALLEMFLDDPTVAEHWRRLGGLETLHSYGVPVGNLMMGANYEQAAKALEAALPHEHFKFLASLKTSIMTG